MIQSIIGSSFKGGGYTPPPPPRTFVADNYNSLQGSTITFTMTNIPASNEGTIIYWWIDGTSPGNSRANQFVENIDNGWVVLSGGLATFTLTPNIGNISFNIYIGYSLYSGFLNLPGDVWVTTLSSNFTIEWWQKMTGSIGENVDRLFDVGNNPNESIGFSEEVQGNRLIVWTGGDLDPTNYIISNLYNTWVHFAIVRNNNTLELYKDGTRLFYTSNNRLIEDNTSDLQIGGGSGQKFNGYLTNFHFLKGVVKYNGTFTPSTIPLNPTEFTETKLLLSVTSSNTTFIDSKGNHTANVIGGTWSSQSPFLTAGVQGTIEFDGSAYNYLTYQNTNLAITGNFTLELFFNKYTNNNYDGLISIGADIAVQFSNQNNLWGKIGGGITDFGPITTKDIPPLNWYHLVIQNDTNVISLILDGAILATQSWTGTTGDTINIGKGLFGSYGVLHGQVSNVRFSNNVRYSTYVRPTEPFTSDANTLLLLKSSDDNNKYLDQGIYSINAWNNTPPGSPNPRWISDTNPYKAPIGGSIYFDGTSTYLNFPGSNDWAIDVVDTKILSLDASTYTGSGPWIDSIGNKQFVLNNNPTYVGTGEKYFSFIAANSQYAQCDTSLPTMNTFTIEVWHYWNGTNTGSQPCIITEIFAGGSINYAIGNLGGGITQGGYFNGGFQASPAFTLTPNTWYQIVITCDSSQVKAYLNNILISTTQTSALPTSSNSGIRLMSRWDSFDCWGGRLGLVNIYNTVLNSTEVETKWNDKRARFGL